MSTAKLHVIGSAHQARFSESFDAELTHAIRAAHDPARAARDLDELSLLSVLAHYAAAGTYDPNQPDLKPMWSLEPVPSDPRVRRHQYVVHYSATRVDIFAFTGIAIAADQTIVDSVETHPHRTTST